MQLNNKVYSNYPDNIFFQGQKTTNETVFGERYTIPIAVEKAKQSIAELRKNPKGNYAGNVICIGNNTFLSVKHLFDETVDFNHIETGIAKRFKKSRKELKKIEATNNKIPTAKTEIIDQDKTIDLALYKTSDTNFSKLKPLTLAKRYPNIGSTIYLIGKNGYFNSIKAIPSKFTEPFGEEMSGYDIEFLTINSELIKQQRDFSAPGLSGSAIVNREGELIGIAEVSMYDKTIYAIGLKTIRQFLNENGMVK